MSLRTAGKAANDGIAEEMARKIESGELSGGFQVDSRNGSGGFDGAQVEFTGEGADMEAVIDVTEVKDYPNRWVTAGEFTSIGDNPQDNWDALVKALGERGADLDDPVTRFALGDAIEAQTVRVEIRVTSGTRVGSQGKNAAHKQLTEAVDRCLAAVRCVMSKGSKIVTRTQP